MAADLHAASLHDLPFLVPGSDRSDPLMSVTVVLMLVGVMAPVAFFVRALVLPVQELVLGGH